MLSGLTLIGTSVVCCGVLFFLICAGLVLWYFFNQPKPAVSDGAPEPAIQATIDHPTAAAPEAPAPPSASDETPTAGE
jgi:hypothetical protein